MGIAWATGRAPDLAINHDLTAVLLHRENHPSTRHLHEDVWEVSPRQAVGGRDVELLWASPDCTHFSKAKGARPLSRRTRALAWAVYRWAEQVRPRCVILENVEEFQDWGPITKAGRPNRRRLGETFRRWRDSFCRLGYQCRYALLRACDYGVPTTRQRLFVLFHLEREPVIPLPTHGPTTWPQAGSVIEWDRPFPSLWVSGAEQLSLGIRVRRPLGRQTLERIADGLRRRASQEGCFQAPPQAAVLPRKDRSDRVRELAGELPAVDNNRPAFLVKYYGTGTSARLDEPLHTLTTRDRFGLVLCRTSRGRVVDVGFRMLTPREMFRAQGFPDTYVIDRIQGKPLPRAVQVYLCGNTVCPQVVTSLVRANVPELVEALSRLGCS